MPQNEVAPFSTIDDDEDDVGHDTLGFGASTDRQPRRNPKSTSSSAQVAPLIGGMSHPRHQRYSTGSFELPPMIRRRSTLGPNFSQQAAQMLFGVDVEDRTNANKTKEDEKHQTDVAEQFLALVGNLCDSKLTTTDAVEGPIAAWHREHLSGVDDPRILSLFQEALPSVVARLAKFEQTHHVSQQRTVCWTVFLTFFDTLSDYCACLVLQNTSYGTPMVAVLLFSMVTQAFVTRYVTKEGPIATLGAFLGFKPILDGVHIIFDIDNQAGAYCSFEAFGFTRATETTTEAIPFSVLQALALMTERQTKWQWISFMISIVNIAHAVASVDFQFDTSPYFRMVEPKCYGIYPGANEDALFVSIAMFALGYVSSKLIAVAVLGTITSTMLAVVLITEALALLLVRVAIGNWRAYNASGDSAAFSIASHFAVVYPSMLAAPFPVSRHPFALSPLVYLGFVAWTLFAANPLMLALAFHYYDVRNAIFPFEITYRSWVALGGATFVSMLFACVAFALMEPEFRHSFYTHLTMAKHIREFHWFRSTMTDGTKITSHDDLDSIRANVLQSYAMAYWPKDLAQDWALQSWERWLKHPPPWFTTEWQTRLPSTWFPGHRNYSDDRVLAIPKTRQETNFRRAIGHTPPWDLGPRDLEAYLNDCFVKSIELPSTKNEVMKRGQLAHQIACAGGVGLLAQCCKSDTKPPWVQISYAANGEPLRGDGRRVQLTSALCKVGLSFYYQLYVSSASHSPLHGYEFIRTVQRKDNYELSLVRNRQTDQLDILTLTSFDTLEMTRMALERRSLSDIQKACDSSEFVASLYHWGSNDSVVFVVGEYCEGGPLSARIKPNVGINNDEEFWRLVFQLAQGLADIHRALGITHMGFKAENVLLTNDGDVRYGYFGLHRVGSQCPPNAQTEKSTERDADVSLVTMLIYSMCTGERVPDLSSSTHSDDLSAKIGDPLKRELVLRSLRSTTTPSADNLTQIVVELAPFDVRRFSNSTRSLVEVEKRAKEAGMEEARRVAKLQAATPCVMICDPGDTADCESALVLMRALRDSGHLKPLGVVANLWPSGERARLLRGTLDVLGMDIVPVGIGSNGGPNDHTERSWGSAQSYTTPPGSEREGSIITGQRLLAIVFEEAAPVSLTLLCTSSLKDAAIFLRDSEALFLKKISSVVIVGGINEDCSQMSDKANMVLTPDESSTREHDMPAARFFYQQCQKLGVPLIVVSNDAARTVPIPSSFYDELAKLSGSPIGVRLREVKLTSMQKQWHVACAYDEVVDFSTPVQHLRKLESAETILKAEMFDSADNKQVVPQTKPDRRWFRNTYCDGHDADRGNGELVWDLVTTMSAPAEMVALLACVPTLSQRFFAPATLPGHSITWGPVEHQVIGVPATTQSAPSLSDFLLRNLRTGVQSSDIRRAAPPLIMITDAGQDLDDEMAMILMRSLQDNGLVDCKGAVANLAPSRARARLVRGTLNVLGLGEVPVATGTDGGFTKYSASFEQTSRDYIASDDGAYCVMQGIDLLKQLYQSASANSLELLCISSLKDAAGFLRAHEQLFVAKTKTVTIMGGVMPFDGSVDDDELLVPDTAHNNTFDTEASAFFYRRCQELRVPLIVVGRYAAYKCPMPRSIYDDMASTGHPIGKRLRDTQRESIEGLWKRACAPEGPERIGLPARCDKTWFCGTFCGGKGGDRASYESIWDLIESFIMYDPVALLCALPSKRYLFNPTVKTVHGVRHWVIGTSMENHGIRAEMVDELTDFMYTSFFRGITLDYSEFENTLAVVKESDELTRRRLAVEERNLQRLNHRARSTREAGLVVNTAVRLQRGSSHRDSGASPRSPRTPAFELPTQSGSSG